MNFIKKSVWSALLLLPALGLAIPAAAQQLADPSEPGSVIVFPKWRTGTVVVDGVTLPQTEIELGVVCPIGFLCHEGDKIKVRFHWVCGGNDKIDNKYICPSADFDVFLTVDGKAVFDPNNIAITGSQFHHVAIPPFNSDGSLCTRGYLIGYVINTQDQPISYNGLIGDAVIRNTASSASAYRAITIQALVPIGTGNNLVGLNADPFNPGQFALSFDGVAGGPGVGHYAAVTGQIYGDVKYDDPVGPIFAVTNFTLLTLDVRQNQPNFPTFVHFDFWSEDEVVESPSLHFICYGQFALSTQIDPNLTKQQMGFRKGVFQSGQAFKTPIGGVNDIAGNVTLLGLIHTFEGADATASERTYIYEPYNNSVPVKTEFLPPCTVVSPGVIACPL
jgi:hypothetical protein